MSSSILTKQQKKQASIAAPNWDLLVEHGLPLCSVKQQSHKKPSSAILLQQLLMACNYISHQPNICNTREAEALTALLLALQTHFPSFYRQHLNSEASVQRVLQRELTGRIIKLRRIAIALLARYL